jgi:hypothetical protein
MGAGQWAEGERPWNQYNGFAAGNTRNLAASRRPEPPQPSREPYSLMKVKRPARPAVAQVPWLHPYFAALLEQLQDAKRRRVTILTPF